MRLLLIGGTVFLGRALVNAATGRGHTLTLFNRGRRNPQLFSEVEKLQGDRTADLSALSGRTWDAVIDTCGYIPRHVEMTADLLKISVETYTFISSVSVYADFSIAGIDETREVGVLSDELVEAAKSAESITGENYGPLKALCEQAVETRLPGRTLNVRPGLIVGPNDPSDRFTYWPARVRRGGEVLAPESPTKRTQVIDVRDLAAWIIKMVEHGETGTYNAVGPERELTIGEVLEESKRLTRSDAHFTWVSEDFLLEQNVGAYVEMPLWVPDSAGAGFETVSARKAIKKGLKFRPLSETIRDTLSWDASRLADEPRRAGLTAERESELLKLWHSRENAAATSV